MHCPSPASCRGPGRCAAAAIAWIFLFGAGAWAQAPDSPPLRLEEAAGHLATQIAQYCAAAEPPIVELGLEPFTAGWRSSASPRVALELSRALGRQVRVTNAPLGHRLAGTFTYQVQDGQPTVVVQAEIRDSSGAVVHSLPSATVTHLEDVLALVQPESLVPAAGTPAPSGADAAAPSPTAEPPSVGAQLAAALEKPAAVVTEQIVRPAPQSELGIELLVAGPTGYRVVPIDAESVAQGEARAVLEGDEPFVVRVHNAGSRPVGLSLSIDGIGALAFSGNPRWRQLGRLIVPPGTTLVKGWHDRQDVTVPFRPSTYGDRSTASLAAGDGPATVHAAFFEVGPAVEPSDYAAALGRTPQSRYIPQPAAWGRLLGAVSVHYPRLAHPADLPEEPSATGN